MSTYEWKTVEEVSTPRTGATALVDHWWPVDADGRVAFYRRHPAGHRSHGDGAPQCNRIEQVARILAGKVHPWAVDVIKIPVAYHREDTS